MQGRHIQYCTRNVDVSRKEPRLSMQDVEDVVREHFSDASAEEVRKTYRVSVKGVIAYLIRVREINLSHTKIGDHLELTSEKTQLVYGTVESAMRRNTALAQVLDELQQKLRVLDKQREDAEKEAKRTESRTPEERDLRTVFTAMQQ